MIPKNIIVLTDDSSDCLARIETALIMAEKFDAYLTGVYPVMTMAQSMSALSRLPTNVRKMVTEHMLDAEKQVCENTQHLFIELTEKAGRTEKSEWRLIHGIPNYIAEVISRYSDISIFGQMSPDTPEISIIDPGKVVSESGRPMFVVPRGFKPKGYTAHAVVGWNGSREAARAIADAMMILGPDSSVTVAVIGKKAEMPESFGFDIVEHLKRKGIETNQAELECKSGDRGLELVNYAESVDADLIVMGAYSRPRMLQEIFGGATSSVLKNMATPVFLSH